MVRHAPIHRRSGHSDIAICCGRNVRGSSPSTSVVPLSNQVTTLNHKRFKGFKMFSDGHLEFVPGFSPRLSFFRSSNASAPKHQSSGSCLFSSIVTKNFCCASASILPANLVPVCEFVCRPTILSTEQEY